MKAMGAVVRPKIDDGLRIALRVVGAVHALGFLLYLGTLIAAFKSGWLREMLTVKKSDKITGTYYTFSAT